jgi:hypothetical protein
MEVVLADLSFFSGGHHHFHFYPDAESLYHLFLFCFAAIDFDEGSYHKGSFYK